MESSILIETIIKVVIILAVFSALAGFTTYIERKILAFMQRRLGPTNVGPFGLLQILCDGAKLFTKEDFIPQNAIKPVFMIAPIITAATAFIAMTAVPFFPEFEMFGYTVRPIVADVNVGVLFVMGVAGIGHYGPLLGGMSSANKWSLLGGARTAIQLLSYEVVSGLAALSPIMIASSTTIPRTIKKPKILIMFIVRSKPGKGIIMPAPRKLTGIPTITHAASFSLKKIPKMMNTKMPPAIKLRVIKSTLSAIWTATSPQIFISIPSGRVVAFFSAYSLAARLTSSWLCSPTAYISTITLGLPLNIE